jgi:hypothetical protein
MYLTGSSHVDTQSLIHNPKMAALDYALLQSRQVLHQLVRRKNWAGKHPGVILVFAIVFTVVVLLIGLWIQRRLAARKAAKEAY